MTIHYFSQGPSDGISALEDSLLSGGKLEGIEITPKSFIYAPQAQGGQILNTSRHSSGQSGTAIGVGGAGGVGGGGGGGGGVGGVGMGSLSGEEGGRRGGPPTPKSSSTPSVSATSTSGSGVGVGSGVGGGGGGGTGVLGSRNRAATLAGQADRPQGTDPSSLTSPPSGLPISPNQKSGPFSVPENTQNTQNTQNINRLISRSGSDTQINGTPGNQGSSRSSQVIVTGSFLGGGHPLSVAHPDDYLEMLGHSLDLHQEENEGGRDRADREYNRDRESHRESHREGGRDRVNTYRSDIDEKYSFRDDKYNTHSEGKYGYSTYEDIPDDETTEEVAERGSIGMSSRPFRVRHRMLLSPAFKFAIPARSAI